MKTLLKRDDFRNAVFDRDGHEGIVVRKADSFKYKDFKDSTCKLVKENFVADGSRHWRFKRMVVNGLK